MISEFREIFERRHERCRHFKDRGGKIVACFYGLVPKELIHAAGAMPVQLIEERNPEYDERSKLLPYLCGMSKNLAGQVYGGVYDYVDGAMVATVCDTNRHLFDIWQHRKVFPYLWLVRAPSTATDLAVRYYCRELQRLARELAAVSGKGVTEEALWQSITLFNENRALLRRFYEARPNSGISPEEAVYVFGAALVMPVEDHNAMMKRLLDSLPSGRSPDGSVPLMISAVNINMAVDVVKMAGRYGATVVTDDLIHNSRYGSQLIEEQGDPFEALARGYLRRIPAPGMYSFEERASYIRETMEKSGARGLIYVVQQYCDAFAMEYAILKERLDAWGIPHLKIEAEDTPASVEQLNVRVQSFVESLV